MGSMTIVLVMFIAVVAVGMVFFMGGDSGKKKKSMKITGCPPGFKPSLAYMEKYGEIGVAYDETQKLLCVIRQGMNQPRLVSPANILAAAIVEDGVVLAKSVRTDEQGKSLLSSLLTEEIKAMFQDAPDASATTPEGTIKPTTQTIELKVLINDPDNPVQVINFLNMEAKKGGLIYNEASGHAKNWQDLLSFLIRLAGKTNQTTPASQIPSKHPPASSSIPHPTPTAVGLS